jgi:hypothetical protein
MNTLDLGVRELKGVAESITTCEMRLIRRAARAAIVAHDVSLGRSSPMT